MEEKRKHDESQENFDLENIKTLTQELKEMKQILREMRQKKDTSFSQHNTSENENYFVPKELTSNSATTGEGASNLPDFEYLLVLGEIEIDIFRLIIKEEIDENKAN